MEMNKLFVFQVSMFLIFSGASVSLLVYTDLYSDIKSTIVDTVCLSCIKMDPAVKFEFTFKTADNRPHPEFILDNLSKGPIFLAFRANVCTACEIMDPIVKKLFDVNFGLSEMFYKRLKFDDSNISFFHINKDDPYEIETEAYYTYIRDGKDAVPMFVIVTLGDNSGNIEPYYMTEYGTLGKNNDQEREYVLRTILEKGIKLYDMYYPKYILQ
jgi:hypothetical protein